MLIRSILRPLTKDSRHFLQSARWVLKVAWSNHSWLVLGLGLVTLAQGLIPAALALVVRELINTAAEGAKSQAATLVPLLSWLLLGLALTISEAVSRLFYRFLMLRFGDDIDLNINCAILEHAARLDIAFFEDPRFQDIIQRARQNAANHFSRLLTDTLAVVGQLLQIASLVAVLVAIEPFVVVVLVPIALVHLLFQWGVAQKRYLEERSRSTKRRWSKYFVSLLTTRLSVPEVKLLGLAPLLIDKFRLLMSEFRDQNRKRYRTIFIGGTVDAILTTIGVYVMFTRVVERFLAGVLTVGDVAVFATVGLRLRSALEGAVSTISNVLEHTLYVSNLQEFLAAQPQMRATRGLIPRAARGEIEFRNVSFAYPGAKKPALSNVSFCIMPGESVAFVGKNGAGKTTLVKLIARFYDPDAGCILYDGVDLRELSLDYLYRHTAFVFQGFGAYEATVFDNIAYGDWDRLLKNRDQVEHIARYTGVDKIIAKMPQGYDTMLGRKFGEYDLSGGQWQQIAIARAFARDAATLLILDEPTASFDATAEHELVDHYRQLARGKTTVLISHRFSTIKMVDRIIVLEGGRIVEEGTHSELLAKGGYYAMLYEFQQRHADTNRSSKSHQRAGLGGR